MMVRTVSVCNAKSTSLQSVCRWSLGPNSVSVVRKRLIDRTQRKSSILALASYLRQRDTILQQALPGVSLVQLLPGGSTLAHVLIAILGVWLLVLILRSMIRIALMNRHS